ncbi:9048_t:CDS:2 [Gigaspora rosea]|nr:9048_t:CDS:2 [Gigaspora rosea]
MSQSQSNNHICINSEIVNWCIPCLYVLCVKVLEQKSSNHLANILFSLHSFSHEYKEHIEYLYYLIIEKSIPEGYDTHLNKTFKLAG